MVSVKCRGIISHMDPRLVITNIGYTISIIFTLSIALFVIAKGKDRRLSILFLLMNIAIAVFETSHLFGINTLDPHLSRAILMCNLANIFIAIFVAHWVLALIGNAKDRFLALAVIDVSGLLLFLFYLFNPNLFLLDSVPKMYLPNYYQPAKWYWLITAYFEIVGVYFLTEIVVAIRRTTDAVVKNRLRYVFWGLIFGFIIGSSAVLLVYNIEVDPLWSMFFSLYTVPFAYAILKYDLMDIRIIAKRAFMYAASVGIVSVFISFLSFSNDWLTQNIVGFPAWVMPLISAFIAVSIAVFVWNKIREADVLKYEFITIITHKLRTPLTRIKWSTENLAGTVTSPEQRQGIQDINYATRSLVDLTNTLVSLSNSEFSLERYDMEPFSFGELAEEIVEKNISRAHNKESSLVIEGGEELIMVKADKDKISFVMQTFVENGINYTSPGGTISVSFAKKNREVWFEVKDNGIGIAKEDIPRVFNKFYRTPNAKQADTEGVGIALYMAKIIIERHGGKISASSEGIGKGSRFVFSLPL